MILVIDLGAHICKSETEHPKLRQPKSKQATNRKISEYRIRASNSHRHLCSPFAVDGAVLIKLTIVI